jgi:superfamily II DNA or RNA helicase
MVLKQSITFLLQVLKGGMDRAERARALRSFRAGEVRVLVMDASGAVGLDLSFVQHVFLMEPLGDLSLEQQIISRAHRLGATHAVHAEVLVMKVCMLPADLLSCQVMVHALRTPAEVYASPAVAAAACQGFWVDRGIPSPQLLKNPIQYHTAACSPIPKQVCGAGQCGG